MDINFNQWFFWTDSTIVLCWIKGDSSQWKTFVANRVSEVQNLTNDGIWRHINTKENPADFISRGVMPEKLIDLTLWWNGTEWLSKCSSEWPESIMSVERNLEFELPEIRKTLVTIKSTGEECFELIKRYSSYAKLSRITAWCLRFIQNCKTPVSYRNLGKLTITELRIGCTSSKKRVWSGN